MRPLLGFLLIVFASSCAPRAKAPDDDAEVRAKLVKVAAHVAKLQSAIAGADEKIRDSCEFQAGDCLVELRDKRRELVRGRTFLDCEAQRDAAAKAECEEGKLIEQGEGEAVARYYDYNEWCLGGVNKCVAQLTKQAEKDRLGAIVEKRRSQFFAAELATNLELDLVIAEQQLKYIRTTLPPAGDKLCTDLGTVKKCRKEAAAKMTEVEECLARPGDKYVEKEAQDLLREAKQAEAECIHLEQACIVPKLGEFGGTDETKTLLDRNLELIAQRERLQAKLPSEVTQGCLISGQAPHEAYIIANYSHYANRPITYYRIQIHRAFARIHEGQIACLKQAAK